MRLEFLDGKLDFCRCPALVLAPHHTKDEQEQWRGRSLAFQHLDESCRLGPQ